MTVENASRPIVTPAKLAIAAVGTAVAAVIANVVIFFIADVAGVWDDILVENLDGEMNIGAIVSLTVLGVLGGALTLFGLTRVSAENGIQWWRYLAIAVLVLSFGSPLSVPDGDVPFILVLEITHIVAGGLTIWALPRFGVENP